MGMFIMRTWYQAGLTRRGYGVFPADGVEFRRFSTCNALRGHCEFETGGHVFFF